MQISDKGCGIIISLLNGLFWYNSAFVLFPACILPKKWGLTSTVVPVSCAPPCSHGLGAADLQRTYFAFWNENYLFGYVILKDPISLGVYCAPFGTEVWAWGKLVWMSCRQVLYRDGAWVPSHPVSPLVTCWAQRHSRTEVLSPWSVLAVTPGVCCPQLGSHGVNLVVSRAVLKLVVLDVAGSLRASQNPALWCACAHGAGCPRNDSPRWDQGCDQSTTL